MIQKLLTDSLMRNRFIHYFVIITSLVFLFTLGPRILVDQLTSTNPNTAIAQDCGQQPCPEVPVPPQPPQECSTSCPAGNEGTCGGHKYWDEAAGAYGECQCETEAQTCHEPAPPPPPPAPPPPPPAPVPPPPASVPPPSAPPPPSSVCSGTPCDRPVGESTCSNGRIKFCKQDAPECGGAGCNCMVETGGTCGGGSGGGSNPPPPPATPCQDHLISCSCSGTNFQCVHQQTNCSTFVENRNSDPGASACLPGATPVPPSPVPPPPTPPAPPPAQGGNSTSTSTANAIAAQQQSQTTSINNVNNNTNTSNSGGNTQTSNGGGTTVTIVWATPTPASTATPSPTSNPTTVTRTINRTTTVVVGQGGGVQPQVIGSKTQFQGTVQELPNTGLPAVGILLAGLGPIGWRLRRYAFKGFNPSSIWNDRELKK